MGQAHAPVRLAPHGLTGQLVTAHRTDVARPIARDDLHRPLVTLEAELEALVRAGHVEAAERTHETRVVLQPPAERQVELAGLGVPALVAGGQPHIGLLALRPAGPQLLVEVDAEVVADQLHVDIGPQLAEFGLGHRGLRGDAGLRVAAAQVGAQAQPLEQRAGPGRQGLGQLVRGHQLLRVDGSEGVAQSSAGGVDVAAATFDARVDRQVGLGLRQAGQPQAQHHEQALHGGLSCFAPSAIHWRMTAIVAASR